MTENKSWTKKRGHKFFAAIFLLMSVVSLGGCGLLDSVKDLVYGDIQQAVSEKIAPAECVSADRYAYQQISGETQAVYDQIVEGIQEQEERFAVSTRDAKVLEQAFAAVLADYGEFFWVSGYKYHTYTMDDEVMYLVAEPCYTMDVNERKEVQQQVDAAIEQWLGDISATATDYDKSKYVFESLIQRVDYDETAEDNQNILSVFLHGKTVCQGYAEAAEVLLHRLGIQSVVVTGTANGEPHAWNLVRLDGEYYYMDVTWGNSSYFTAEDSEEKKTVNYYYLNMTTRDISVTHEPDGLLPVPECTAVSDNYYVHEGRYFDKWDADAIGTLFEKDWKSGAGKSSVRLSNDDLYWQTVSYFITEHHLSDYIGETGTLHYLDDGQKRILTLQF